MSMLIITVMSAAIGATTVDLTVVPKASTLSSNSAITSIFPGTLIGNWDELENPTGTLTLPGLWGGSGNQFISMTSTLVLDGAFVTVPSGSLSANIDLDTNTLIIDDLSLDLLNGVTPVIPLTLELLYETFRTFQPDSLYVGGFTIPIPIGEAHISQLQLLQGGSSGVAMLTPEGKGEYAVNGVVPVLLTMEATFLGQSISPEPFPVPLVLAGVLVIDGGTVSLTIASTSIVVDETIVGDPENGFENLPFDLPTMIPPGEVAHILISGALDSLTTQLDLNLTIVAEGDYIDCPADVNSDGSVDLLDLLAVIGVWGQADEVIDITGDGIVDISDLLAVLDLWGLCV